MYLATNIRYTKWRAYLLQEDISLGHLPDGSECVLHDTHDRLVCLRGDDLSRCHVNVLHLSSCLHTLRNVQVHLVPVKVSVIRWGTARKRLSKCYELLCDSIYFYLSLPSNNGFCNQTRNLTPLYMSESLNFKIRAWMLIALIWVKVLLTETIKIELRLIDTIKSPSTKCKFWYFTSQWVV